MLCSQNRVCAEGNAVTDKFILAFVFMQNVDMTRNKYVYCIVQ